jgi:hypothetical protein
VLGEVATTIEWRSKKLASPRSTIPRSSLAIFSSCGQWQVRGQPTPKRTATVLLAFVQISCLFLVIFLLREWPWEMILGVFPLVFLIHKFGDNFFVSVMQKILLLYLGDL